MIRTLGAAIIAALGIAAGGAAQAEYPEKPIQIVVPAGPGSATDTLTRLVLNEIEAMGTLGQPAVVINVQGGPVAATRVKDAPADGYELLVYHIGLFGSKAAGTIDFGAEVYEPLAQTGRTSFLVVVAENGPYADLNALVEAAKAAPGTLQEANAIGGAVHVATLQLAEAAGYEARVVQVGDGPSRLQSVLGAHTAYTVVSPQEYKGFSGAGIKAVAVLGSERIDEWPDVPTTHELGYATEISVDTWWFAPKGIPEDVRAKLVGAIGQAMEQPSLQEAFLAQGVSPVFLSGADLDERLATVGGVVERMADKLTGN